MHLEKLDLNLLVAIDALLRRRSVTSAAEELHITQSAMSSALKRARQHFDDDLFYYNGQAMMPTSFGQELSLQIPDIVNQLRSVSRMRSTTDLRTLKRRFTIIASDYVAAVFASALTKKLAVLAPDVSLSILPYTREALRQFQRGTIDFLIGPDFALETKHSAELLFEDRFKCVLWKENSFANTAMTPEDFFDAPMILTNFFLENGLCCTNRSEADLPLTPDGFSLQPRY
ncbi:LysR family transcriptional regulator, partial [Planktotalea sp.]|uniref:LysR family transcriptional regulator n=1 Tax=Planktotalea sp. TaxID=2029877 RepID=UPI003F6D163C